jgi:hypothetical protein
MQVGAFFFRSLLHAGGKRPDQTVTEQDTQGSRIHPLKQLQARFQSRSAWGWRLHRQLLRA